MVRIKVKNLVHDCTPRKPALVQTLAVAEVWVNKIIETKEAFILIADNENMDKLMKEENRQKLAARGLEIVHPPEYEASRTVILKNVDSLINAMTEDEIVQSIDKNLKVKRVIKISNSPHLMKLIFERSQIADRVVEEGLKIKFQKFQKTNIEKEIFIPIVPCFKCFSYEHLRRNCPKPDEYRICSSCAIEGHLYTDCSSDFVRCIGCGANHRTLAAKCPIRKEIIRNKIKEKRVRSRSAYDRDRGGLTQTQTTATLLQAQTTKLPEHYLAVMAAAITRADKREAEVPGSFQFIINEMLKANKVPEVKFPESVISGFKDQGKEGEKRKRQRSSDEAEATGGGKTMEYKLLSDGTWVPVTTPSVTPLSTPAATPAPTPLGTPTPTPAPTSASTPVTSPQRPGGAVPKKHKVAHEKDPGLLIIVRSDIILQEMNNQQMKKK